MSPDSPRTIPSRLPNRLGPIVGAAALALALTACGGGGKGVTTTKAAPNASSTVNDASPEVRLSSGPWRVKNVVIQDRVVGLEGQKAADDATALVVDIAKDYAFNENSLKYVRGKGKAEGRKWMLDAREGMTADAAADWTKTVNLYFRHKGAGDNPALGDVLSLTGYDLYEPSMRFEDPSKPMMTDMTVKSLEVDLAGDGRVWATMETTAKYHFMNKGKERSSLATRKQEFWLKQVGGQWKIDGWNGTFNVKMLDRT